MPIGEIIGEVFLRVIFEFVFYTVGYYTGAVVLWVLTLGRLPIAPLSTIEKTNRGRSRWNDWSFWLHRPLKGRALKAEWVCVVGIVVWFTVGAWIYLTWGKGNSEQSAHPNHSQTLSFQLQ